MIKSAPVGPVAGGIMGCIMVLVLAVYAYRHQIHRRSHQHMSPLAAQGKCDSPAASRPALNSGLSPEVIQSTCGNGAGDSPEDSHRESGHKTEETKIIQIRQDEKEEPYT